MIHHYSHTGRTAAENQWVIGNVVKVGFCQLRVLGVHAVKDGLPDIYTLESLDGARLYQFTPHHGLVRLDTI